MFGLCGESGAQPGYLLFLKTLEHRLRCRAVVEKGVRCVTQLAGMPLSTLS